MWMWSLPREKCRWSSLICSAPMNWSHALLLLVMQIFGGSIFSQPSVFLGWWIVRWGLWLHSAALNAVSSCSPGWSWPNESPGPSSQMVIWMMCCCYLFHLLHQTFHLLVRRSSIKFLIDWFRIVNCVFYSNKCISGVRRSAAPAALTFLSVALSLQKVGHPWSIAYGSETWTLTKHQERKLAMVQRSMERSPLSITKRYKIRNKVIRSKTRVTDIVEKYVSCKLLWCFYAELKKVDNFWTTLHHHHEFFMVQPCNIICLYQKLVVPIINNKNIKTSFPQMQNTTVKFVPHLTKLLHKFRWSMAPLLVHIKRCTIKIIVRLA